MTKPRSPKPRSLRGIEPSIATDEPESRSETPLDGVQVQLDRPRRVRSPSDLLRLLIGSALVAFGLILATYADHTVGGAQADIVDAVSRLPTRLEQAVIGVAQVIAGSLIVVITVVLIVQRQWRRLGVLILGAVVATLAMQLADQVLDLPDLTHAISVNGVTEGWLSGSGFPSSAYLASSAAVVTLASVWMSRRWKRALWGAIAILALLRVLSSATGALDVVLAIAIGVVVGSLALVVFGAPNRAPETAELIDALRAIAPGLHTIRQAGVGSESIAYCVDVRGRDPLFVKLRTPDDRSADYLSRIIRSVRLRSHEIEPPYGTVQRRIEHEALAIHRATDGGAATPPLVAVLSTASGSAMLVTEQCEGRRLADLDADSVDRALLDRLWVQVGLLARARIAHRDLTLENVIVDARNRPHLVDFDDAELAATDDDRARDVAQLLVETSLLVGVDTAVVAAIDGIGPARVAAALPLLQPLALPGAMRRRLRRGNLSLEALRECVEERTGTSRVPLEKLDRVQPRTLLSVIALTAAFYFLLPQLANLGSTWDAVQNASWQWIPILLLASALTYFFAAIAFIGSVSEPIPFLSALRSRVASSFVSSFAPAGTGGMALGVRVLQRAGVDPSAATASVGLNLVVGLIVHVALLFAFVSWTGKSGVGGFSWPDRTVLIVGVSVIFVVSVVALLVRRIRQLIIAPVVRGRAAGTELAAVFRSPQRVAELVFGAAGTTMSYVLGLVAAVAVFGGGLSIPQVGAAYLVASLIGNAAPTPGGLGAVEAALVAALAGFGMKSGPAVSAVLTFRLATYWLPTLPGWLTFRWMQAHEEI